MFGSADDPQTWDRYAYARDNPIMITDPSGESFWSDLVGVFLDVSVFFTGGATAPAAAAYTAVNSTVDAVQDFRKGNDVAGAFDLSDALLAGSTFFGRGGSFGIKNPESVLWQRPTVWPEITLIGIYQTMGKPGLPGSSQDPVQTLAHELGWPSMADVGCNPICDAAANKVASAIKSWWGDVSSCFMNYARPTLESDLNPLTPGVMTPSDMASQMSQASLQAAAYWSVSQGLTVPLRSSIVRAGLSNAEALGKLSGVLAVAGIDVALADAVYAEYKGCL